MNTGSDFAASQDRADASQPSVLVRLGALDSAAIGQARRVFADPAVAGASSVVVDVGGIDDHHELTGFAPLAELSLRLGDNGRALIVVNPPARLAGHLQASGIHVRWDVNEDPNGGLTIEVGRQAHRPEHGAPVTPDIAVPTQANGADREGAR